MDFNLFNLISCRPKDGKSILFGFTLLELLIVIGILATLAAVIILVLNPAELLNSSRDIKRLAELNTLNKILALYRFDNTSGFGSSSIVYLSLPDNNSNCLSYANLPAGYTYSCKPESSYRKVDGTGWIPVNFSNISAGNPLSSLPVDPVNNEEFYFTYIVSNNDNWELTAKLKSESKKPLALNEKDGGDDNNRYELGAVLSVVSAGYQATVVAEASLVSYWKMDNNWLDSKGVNHGTAYGATFGAAKYGTAAGSFDGGSSYVQIPKISSFDLGSDFTISCWFKRDASEAGDFRVLMGKVSSAGADGWYIRKGTTVQGNALNLELGNSLQQYRAYGPSSYSVPVGSWQYYVFTRQGANWKVYLNGSLAGSGSNFESPYVNNYDLYIGRLGNSPNYYWYGLIDEVSFFNTALSAATISSHYAAGI